MTPVIKAFLTDKGFDNTNIALQTLGGHGYIKEYGIEQYVRDARIAQIYEGTNAVQALDLVGRKLPMEGGRLVRRFFELVKADVEASARRRGDGGVREAARPPRCTSCRRRRCCWPSAGFANPDEAGAAATEYLHLMGYVAVGWQWLRMVTVAKAKLAAGHRRRRSWRPRSRRRASTWRGCCRRRRRCWPRSSPARRPSWRSASTSSDGWPRGDAECTGVPVSVTVRRWLATQLRGRTLPIDGCNPLTPSMFFKKLSSEPRPASERSSSNGASGSPQLNVIPAALPHRIRAAARRPRSNAR